MVRNDEHVYTGNYDVLIGSYLYSFSWLESEHSGGQNNTIPPTDADADAAAAADKTRSSSPKALPASVPNNRIPAAKKFHPDVDAAIAIAAAKTRRLYPKVPETAVPNHAIPTADVPIVPHAAAPETPKVAAAKTRILSQKVPPTPASTAQTRNSSQKVPPKSAAAAKTRILCPQVPPTSVPNDVIPTVKVAAVAHTAACGTLDVHVVPVTPLTLTVAATPVRALAHVAAFASKAKLSHGGEVQNGTVPTAAVTPAGARHSTLPSNVFEDDSQCKVHKEAMKRHVKACLQNQGANGFFDILTDKLITAVSQDIKLVFSQLMNKVYIITTRRQLGEALGAIPRRVVDAKVNLFLHDSGAQLIRKIGILDTNKLTSCFKDCTLNSVIHIDDSTGITEYTPVKGEYELPEGKSYNIWSTNVVNYKTILMYMKVYLSRPQWYVHSVEFPPAPLNEDQGPFFYQRFQDNIGKGKRYVLKMVSFFDASYLFAQMEKTVKQIWGKEVLGQTKTGPPSYLKFDWPSDVSKTDLAFQKVLMSLWVQFQQEKTRIFEEVNLDHFADEVNLNHFVNESFVDDNFWTGQFGQQNWILTVIFSSFFKARGAPENFE
eukprot:jgi/Psemu1/2039/gm1.2039_g